MNHDHQILEVLVAMRSEQGGKRTCIGMICHLEPRVGYHLQQHASVGLQQQRPTVQKDDGLCHCYLAF